MMQWGGSARDERLCVDRGIENAGCLERLFFISVLKEGMILVVTVHKY